MTDVPGPQFPHLSQGKTWVFSGGWGAKESEWLPWLCSRHPHPPSPAFHPWTKPFQGPAAPGVIVTVSQAPAALSHWPSLLPAKVSRSLLGPGHLPPRPEWESRFNSLAPGRPRDQIKPPRRRVCLVDPQPHPHSPKSQSNAQEESRPPGDPSCSSRTLTSYWSLWGR